MCRFLLGHKEKSNNAFLSQKATPHNYCALEQFLCNCWLAGRKSNMYLSSFVLFTFYGNPPIVALDYALANAKSQARALSLCCKEWIKQFR